ncbi:ADP-ribosylglycohydrolase family protein [Methylobacterium brachythecii]|uniref:ADP-ribosyl-[dinitrogen reductase] hydrolase n=1 Tax=Methylobacterium brachythecii TaxID=1176177 RepID=A0A7W6AN68_9HYPH|nr:ADP-ribosylglycohydrolase family protein [Methylobacterium brachythecii]MBB3905681.1 ADP-ribosyl-[dinitrogen reductase] hydrolase [Methylobacterium brachythecii]GLS46941.1 ADP-ribosylglycohydrolase [Methylobacterium brachythecii]
MLTSIEDRAQGAFLGLAVGDALGATLEFEDRDTRPHHTEMLGGGPFDLKPGQWTDDTSMALALAESLIAHPEFNATDLMTRFVAWAEQGEYSCTGTCFDIGIVTRNSLGHFRRTGDPFAGSTAPDRAGNGSLMRIAPVALRALEDDALAAQIARDQSRTTHATVEAVEACDLFVRILREAIRGDGQNALRPRAWKGTPTIQAIAAGAWRGKPREKIRSTGYVVDTLEAALWCTEQAKSFEEALVLAVNLAGDADTVGAVTGQVAGAVFGVSAIPQRWLEPLAWHDQLLALAVDLVALSKGGPAISASA